MGTKTSRIGPANFIIFVIIIVLGLSAHLWVRLEVVRQGYEHQTLVSIKKKIIEENRQLRLRYAEIVSPARIEKYAKQKFGLSKPEEKQFRYLK
jgi:hypothetical protein